MLFEYLYYFLEEIYNFLTDLLKSFLPYFIDFKPDECGLFDIQKNESDLIEKLNNLLYSISDTKKDFAADIVNDELKSPCINIDNLVFSGGGAKGITYPGAYRALNDSGILEEVKRISGASAGSIISAFIAVGMPIKKFREEISSTNFKSLLGDTIDFFSNLPGTIRFFTKSGDPLYEFIKININKSINEFLNSDDYNYDELTELKDKFQNENINTLKFTFNDLSILHQLFPEKFKLLYVNAVNSLNGDNQNFNHEDTPDVEIALACRASSAIPGLIQPVEIEINGKVNRYIDGGVLNNIPFDCFNCESHNNKTLLFSFGEGLQPNKNWTHHALHGSFNDEEQDNQIFKPNLIMKFIRKIPSWLGIISLPYCIDEKKDEGLKNIRKKFRLRTVELRVANISVTAFDYAEKVAPIMDALGYLDTMNYLINHNTYDLFAKGAYPEFYDYLFKIFYASFEFISVNPYLNISKTDKKFFKFIAEIKNTSNTRELIYNIKEFTENNLESSIAYILAKSVELISNLITPEELCEDITESHRKFAYPEVKLTTSVAYK